MSPPQRFGGMRGAAAQSRIRPRKIAPYKLLQYPCRESGNPLLSGKTDKKTVSRGTFPRAAANANILPRTDKSNAEKCFQGLKSVRRSDIHIRLQARKTAPVCKLTRRCAPQKKRPLFCIRQTCGNACKWLSTSRKAAEI